MKLRRLYLPLLFLPGSSHLGAQESSSVFNFLSLPSSAHGVALGGRNISLIEDDASLSFQNPALLGSVSNNTLGLNFLTYMRGTKSGSASFARLHGERGTWGINAQFTGYGSIRETDITGAQTGSSRPLDVALSGLYSYNLGERWAGGAAGKLIYSNYAGHTSFAMAADLGINYYDEEIDFSLSAVAANLGGQLKAFGDKRERLPFNLMVGFTKRLAHAPLRIHVTMSDLTRWSAKYYYSADGNTKGGRIFMNHFTLGVDLIPSDRFYIGMGWDFRRAYEMKAAGSGHMAGLSVGAGMMLKRFQIGIAYAKYHVSSPTFSVSLSTRL